MNYNPTPEFEKDFKYYLKKYPSLKSDLEIFKIALEVSPYIQSRHLAILTKTDKATIFKFRFPCRSLPSSNLRIIYSFLEEENLIEFIELYSHNDNQVREDQARIKKYLKQF